MDTAAALVHLLAVLPDVVLTCCSKFIRSRFSILCGSHIGGLGQVILAATWPSVMQVDLQGAIVLLLDISLNR